MSSKITPQNHKAFRLNYFSQSFQLRYGIWLAMIGTFCFFLVGFLVYLAFNRTIQNSPQGAMIRQLLGQVLAPKAILFNYEVTVPAFILAVFLVAIGIVGTHKIAGPLFAIKRHMQRVRAGHIRSFLKLRNGDELMDLTSALNAMLKSWWDRESAIATQLAEIQFDLNCQRHEEAIQKLEALSCTVADLPAPVLQPTRVRKAGRAA